MGETTGHISTVLWKRLFDGLHELKLLYVGCEEWTNCGSRCACGMALPQPRDSSLDPLP